MGPIEVVAVRTAWRRLAPRCSRLLRRLRRETGQTGSVTLMLAPDRDVRRLNRVFRGKDRTTDVLSFPSTGDLEPRQPHIGDLVVSVPQARRQARRAAWSLDEEMTLLVTHGYLHLLGYDHERDDGTMRRLEEKLLRTSGGISLSRRRLPWGASHEVAGERSRE
jgi:probable rRNA maturation factor